jgi:hypothetical protein
MTTEPIGDPLAKYLRIYANPNVDLVAELGRVIAHEVPRAVAADFKRQLAHAINNPIITPDLYKKITTDNEYYTQDLVQGRLLEIWRTMYGTEPVVE